MTDDDDDFPFVSEGTVQGLARDNKYWREKADDLMHKCAKLQEENDELKAYISQIEHEITQGVDAFVKYIHKLRAALQALVDEIKCFSIDPPSEAMDKAIEEADRLLESKQCP